jgi:DNA-binding transcriptional LysR family regulator
VAEFAGAGGVPGALRAGSLDVALTADYDYVPAEPDPALDTEPLFAEPVYLAAAEPDAEPATDPDDDEQEDGRSAGIRRWRDAAWIAGSPGSQCHSMVLRACQASGFTPRIRHHAGDFATVLALVAAGQGVSLIPGLGLTGTPAGVTLAAVAARRHISIACRKGTGGHPAVAAFAEAVREECGHRRDR